MGKFQALPYHVREPIKQIVIYEATGSHDLNNNNKKNLNSEETKKYKRKNFFFYLFESKMGQEFLVIFF